MSTADWSSLNSLVNELTAVLREYRRSYHSTPDAYGYHHLGAIAHSTVERADAVIARAERTLVQEWRSPAEQIHDSRQMGCRHIVACIPGRCSGIYETAS